MATRKISPSGRNDNTELERLDDEALARLVRERANQPTIPVSVEDLSGPGDTSGGSRLTAQERRGAYCVVSDNKGCHSEPRRARHSERSEES